MSETAKPDKSILQPVAYYSAGLLRHVPKDLPQPFRRKIYALDRMAKEYVQAALSGSFVAAGLRGVYEEDIDRDSFMSLSRREKDVRWLGRYTIDGGVDTVTRAKQALRVHTCEWAGPTLPGGATRWNEGRIDTLNTPGLPFIYRNAMSAMDLHLMPNSKDAVGLFYAGPLLLIPPATEELRPPTNLPDGSTVDTMCRKDLQFPKDRDQIGVDGRLAETPLAELAELFDRIEHTTRR